MIQVAGERIEALGPEFVVTRQPHGRFLHGLRRQSATHHASFLQALDQPSVLENAQVLHKAGQRHVVRLRQLGNGEGAVAQRRENLAPRGIGKRGEDRIERCILILNHKVKY